MTEYRLVSEPQADFDIEAIFHWYENERARLGLEFLNELRLFRWLSDKEWERWDRQIETDSQAGRLGFLIHEASHEKSKGELKDL